jgi:hypothetical protein
MWQGYGVLTHGGQHYRAHRVAYELFVGPIPDGLVVRHKTDIPIDVNPQNLEIGTQSDNNWDRVARGRSRPAQGVRHGRHKLTDDEVREIRRLKALGAPGPALADQFGISTSNLYSITNYQSWRHLH